MGIDDNLIRIHFDGIDGAAGPGPAVSDPDLMRIRVLEHQPILPLQNDGTLTEEPLSLGHNSNLVVPNNRQLPEFLLSDQSQIYDAGFLRGNGNEGIRQTQREPIITDENEVDQNFYNVFKGPFHNLSSGHINVTKDVDVAAAISVFGFNIIVFALLIAAYEMLSRCLPSVYSNKKYHVSKERLVVQIPQTVLPLGWIPNVYRVSWNQILKAGGLEAYFFLRYIRMCLQICAVSGLWGIIILWPVYFTGGNHASGWYYVSMSNVTQGSWRIWFPAIFMWLTSYYVFFLMNEEYKHYFELRMNFLSKGDLNIHVQTQHSIIVEEIPYELRSDKSLYNYFDSIFPGKVHSAHVALNIPDLEREGNKRRRVLRRLEKSLAYYEATGKKASHIVGQKRCRCCGIETFPIVSLPRTHPSSSSSDDDSECPEHPHKGERVDSITYYTNQLELMNKRVKQLQSEKRALSYTGDSSVRTSQWISHMLGLAGDAAANTLKREDAPKDGLILGFNQERKSPSLLGMMGLDFVVGGLSYLHRNIDVVGDVMTGSPTSSTGFVTFKDLATVACATTAPICHDPEMLIANVAPDYEDIVWENIHINLTWSRGRELTANLFLALGAILWSLPVASIQALASIDSLAEIPGMDWLKNVSNARFSSFINSYLPVVLLLLIILILPIVFEWIAVNYELRKTRSNVQSSILGRYFYYQLANIYVTATAGSLLDSLANILNHPGNVFELLGRSFPTVVGYFITLLITRTLAGLPAILLRFGALSRWIFLKCCFKEKYLNQMEIDEVNRKEMLFYGWEYPMQLLIIVICFTYACISPIILPVGAFYFLGALIVYKKQVLVVYTTEYESGGTCFPAVCHRTLIGLICGQVTLIGYVIIRAGFYQPVILLPLPFLTLRMMQRFKTVYSDAGMHLSLERGIQLDQDDQIDAKFSEEMYWQPVLAEGEAKIQPYRRDTTENLRNNPAESGKIV